jgi:hypothetical protein
MKPHFIYVLLLLAQTAFAQANLDNNSAIYTFAEHRPEFPGGETALLQYVLNNISTSAEIQPKTKLYLEFVIEKDGSISNFKNTRGIVDTSSAGYKAHFSVIQNMPKWAAAKHKGKAVRFRYILPIDCIKFD